MSSAADSIFRVAIAPVYTVREMEEAIVAIGIQVFNQWQTEEATDGVIEYVQITVRCTFKTNFWTSKFFKFFIWFLFALAQLNLQALNQPNRV